MQKLHRFCTALVLLLIVSLQAWPQSLIATFETTPSASCAQPAGCQSFEVNVSGVPFVFTLTTQDAGGSMQFLAANGGFNGSGSMDVLSGVDPNFNTTETVTIKRKDGLVFNFSSIYIQNTLGEQVSANAFLGANPVGPGFTVAKGVQQTLNFANAAIDKVVLSSTDFFVTSFDHFAACVTPVPSFTTGAATEGAPVSFTDASTRVATEATYAWDFENDGIVDNTTVGNVSHTYPNDGNFTAKLTITQGVCSNSFQSVIAVAEDVAPTVTINQAAAQIDPVNTSSVIFTVVFSEPVSGFIASDVLISGTAPGTKVAVVTGGPTTYTVSISGMTGSGTVIASIPAGSATDLDGVAQPNAASTSTDNSVTYDVTAPSVTINQAAGQSDPTSSSTVHFTVVFSEPVTGFTQSDVSLGGTANATTVSITEQAPNNGTTYDVAVSGMTGDGTITASIPANQSFDAAGNGNLASTSTDNTITYVADVPPSVTSINRYIPLNELTNANTVVYRIIFSEPVTGVDASDFTITFMGGLSGGSLTVSGSGDTYEGSVSGLTGSGTVRLDLNGSGTGIKDVSAGQNIVGGFTGQTYTIDQVAPALTFVGLSSDNANNLYARIGNTVTLAFTANEGLTTPIVSIAGNAVAAPVNTIGNSWTATYVMSSTDAEGPISFSIQFGDAAGNSGTTATATTNGSTVTFDRTAPVALSINRFDPATAATAASTLVYQATFTEGVSGVGVSDFNLVASGPASGSVISVSQVSAAVYNISVNVLSSGGGSLRLDLNGSGTGIADAAGNGISGGFTGQSYTLGVPPSITNCPADVSFATNVGQCYATVTKATLLNGLVISGTPTPVVTVWVGSTEITTSYNFPVGQTGVTVKAANSLLPDAVCSFTVQVSDEQAPTISAITQSLYVLAPPNHKMRDVTLGYTVTDNCPTGLTYSVSVSSNEPQNGTGDGDTDSDWEVVNNHLVRLRAERAAKGDGRIYTIIVTATDASGNTTTSSPVTVIVSHNIVTPVSGQTVKVGTTVNFSGIFWDKPGNRHTATWTLDGTATTQATLTEPAGMKNGTVTGSYKFTAPGIYKLQMNVKDQAGVTTICNTSEDMDAIIVVYDPSGGFTVGGGWFVSQPGALTGAPAATGKVSFGFQSNYFKGATVPKGETQLEFKVGNLEFNALNFDYLVVSGAKAQFKGTGKIKGDKSGYGFIMTVVDGEIDGSGADKIRMKIFNKNNGKVIYDNQPGASDAAAPTTVVGAGSTITITGGGSSTAVKSIIAPAGRMMEPNGTLTVRVLPNPSHYAFTLVLESSSNQPVTIRVMDASGRVIETRSRIGNNGALQLGQGYAPGVYYAEVVQGTNRKVVKLVKVTE